MMTLKSLEKGGPGGAIYNLPCTWYYNMSDGIEIVAKNEKVKEHVG